MGCPAHAGIDLKYSAPYTSQVGLPRTRGDRPYAIQQMGQTALVAPHTRG